MQDLSRRVERRFLEIESRLRGEAHNIQREETDYVGEKFERYQHHLNEIMKNVREARAEAPCSGCKKTIEGIKVMTLSAITALAVYKAMTSEGRERSNFSDKEIQKIKEAVELQYIKY